jgi:hypothetical protein
MTVTRINLYNTGVGANVCTISVWKSGSAAARVFDYASVAASGRREIELPAHAVIFLEEGDAIYGDDGGTGAEVDYLIFGGREVQP